MKSIIIISILLLFSMNAFGEEGSITRFGKWMDGAGKTCTECAPCPVSAQGVVCPNTPVKDVKRAAFEVGLRFDTLADPNGGTIQVRMDNFSFMLKHNFSNVFNIYASYGISTIEKTDYDNSLYDPIWHYQTVVVGAGWYIHPIVELFVGLGKVMPENSQGSEELGMAFERGLRAHWALNNLGYKVNLSLVSREVPLADPGVDINRSPAVGTVTFISVGIDIPVAF